VIGTRDSGHCLSMWQPWASLLVYAWVKTQHNASNETLCIRFLLWLTLRLDHATHQFPNGREPGLKAD
jgi:hypothetical protein